MGRTPGPPESFLQGDNDKPICDFLFKIFAEILLHGFARFELPHTSIHFGERNTSFIHAQEEKAFGLIHFLKSAVRAKRKQRLDLRVGLQSNTLCVVMVVAMPLSL